MESLTDSIEEEAWGYLKRIEEPGGYVSALEKGYLQREIAEAAQRYQQEVERGERVIVGVNKYVSEGQAPIETFCYNPHAREVAIARLKDFKSRRNQVGVLASLARLREAAIDPDGYLMPLIIDAVKSNATLGEVMGVFREVFGKYGQENILAGSC